MRLMPDIGLRVKSRLIDYNRTQVGPAFQPDV